MIFPRASLVLMKLCLLISSCFFIFRSVESFNVNRSSTSSVRKVVYQHLRKPKTNDVTTERCQTLENKVFLQSLKHCKTR
jgi:hypothetical protein